MNLGTRIPSQLTRLLCFLLVITMGFTDEDLRYRRIRDALNRFTIVYPQQKVYLHLDKTSYDGGDNMWIKAYLLNGMNHYPDTLSTNLYVELISPSETRVDIKRLQMFHGFGVGDFRLSDTLPEGMYQIRAYTNWMQNFSVDFFFEKNFQVYNPSYSKRISPREARSNQKEMDNREKMVSDLDIQFMPEGGSLVTGLASVIGFKAINRLGRGVEISGQIVDDRGNVVTDFRSFYKGIGKFSLTPEKDRNYFALVTHEGRESRIALPKPMETGLVMQVTNNTETILVSLQSNKPPSADRTANEVILVGQVGGRVYYHEILALDQGRQMAVLKKQSFPSGIIQITAFSGRIQPLAERLVFNNRLDYMKIHYSATDTLTDRGNRVLLSLFVSDEANKPVPSNLSLSIVREKTPQSSFNNDNIISNLLLSSDIKGFIEDPYDYFRENTAFTREALDNLMMTQGWRRFDWASILEGEFPKIRYHEERGIAIYGQITHDFFGIPLKNCKVQLSILSAYNDVFTQFSTERGYFLFDSLVYYDTISVKLEAWRQSGRRNLVIVIPDEEMKDISGFQGPSSLITESNRDKKAYRQERFEESLEAYEKEQEELKKERENELHGLYSEPDYVLRSEDFPKGSHDVLDVMKGRIPGVNIYGNQVIIRGPNSIYGSNQPLFLLDGMPTIDVEAVRSIPVEEIERIEVLKGPSAAIYGMRGANGVIAVYTKRGNYMKRGVLEFDMLGYATPRKFYQPRYKPEDEPATNYTVFWEPVIITDQSGKATLLIEKPLTKGDYRLVIEGISYLGHVGMVNELITNE